VPWQELRFVCDREQAQAISDALDGSAALAVTLADAEDNPIYEPALGSTPLWSLTRVTALFAEDHPVEQEMLALAARIDAPLPPGEIVQLRDQDWVQAGQRGFEARQFGKRLWVVPSWSETPVHAEVSLRIDPGLAFGTGAHPSTAMCLEWLDANVREDCRVCDYGSGSGVLAVAACVLGAGTVLATDIDDQALLATRSNAQANNVEQRLRTAAAHLPIDETFELLVANILAGPLITLAPRICNLLRAGGRLALAGLLLEQSEDVIAAYVAQPGLSLQHREVMEGWARLDFYKSA
jgi:ribosomal protein L11 methyltransferase